MAKKHEIELVQELAEALEELVADEPTSLEPAVEPLETATPVIGSYTLIEGDSWASVAAKHPLAGKTKHERATELAAKHGEAVAGKVVEL